MTMRTSSPAEPPRGQAVLAELRQRGIVAGTAPDLAEQLHAIAAAGAQRVMLQWFGWDDMAELEAIAAAVLPAFPPAPR